MPTFFAMGRGDLLIVATVGVMHHLMSNHFKKLILIYHFGPIYSQCRYTKEIEGAASAKALGFLLQSDKYVFLYSMILVSGNGLPTDDILTELIPRCTTMSFTKGLIYWNLQKKNSYR